MNRALILQKIKQAADINARMLDLTRMELTEIPEEVTQLTNLSELFLGNNQITVIPDSIAQLKQLSNLDLDNNQITLIPDSIAQLTNLSILHLNANQITVIPASIAQLTNLSILHLNANQITVIPDSIAQLSNLSILDLSDNQISIIPDAIAQLKKLSRLNLDGNHINLIPDSIAQLSNLTQLSLIGNQIRTIPDSIAQLENLSRLDLSNNQISAIPDSIAALKNLSALYLDYNQISVIPDSIAASTSFSALYLNHNQISVIPLSIAQSTHLKRLLLQHNPITNAPPEIIRKGWGKYEWEDGDLQAMVAYLKSMTKRPLNELKVLLVGESDVGKTSLLNCLLDKPFNDPEPKTIGINIDQLQLPTESETVRLRLWDFGGQHLMHDTHQLFLTQRSLYLLVIDNRKTPQQNRTEYWLQLIKTYGGDSPVIIVGNYTDEQPLDRTQQTLQTKYPQIKQFIATSCKTGQGIAELRDLIIDSIPSIHDPIPLTWLDIKTQLKAIQSTEDIISYEQYQDLCRLANLTTEADQKTLASILHDRGIILNFQTDRLLQDPSLLNPEWFINGIYTILNHSDLSVKKRGILTLHDLIKILQPIDRYPLNRRLFLMGLLEKLERCFKLEGFNPDYYVIPDLLPIEVPDITPYKTASLHFQYCYEISPSSILSRFIVRNHKKIYKNILWRNGVVLTQDLAIALVCADDKDNVINIKIQGNPGNALLSKLRDDFEKIHNTIPYLVVRESLVDREVSSD